MYLDLIGVQPKPDEVRAFLADTDPKKREKVVDALFERPEFVDHWSLKWGDLLQNSRNVASVRRRCTSSASSSAGRSPRTCRWTSSPAGC